MSEFTYNLLAITVNVTGIVRLKRNTPSIARTGIFIPNTNKGAEIYLSSMSK
jgi:hypothetical protein